MAWARFGRDTSVGNTEGSMLEDSRTQEGSKMAGSKIFFGLGVWLGVLLEGFVGA